MGRKGLINLGGTGQISGSRPATAPGQLVTYEQIPGLDPYAGGFFARMGPQTTTGVFTDNCGSTTSVGAITTPAPTLGSFRTVAARTNAASTATAGTIGGVRCSSRGLVWRGNAPGYGGFRYVHAFSVAQVVAGNRGFVGLTNSLAAPTNIDPLTTTAISKVGIAFNVNTGNLQMIHNLAGTAPTVIDLGADFALNTTGLFELEIKCLENASSIDWKMTKAGSAAIAQNVITSNMPGNSAATDFLAPSYWITNNTTAAICSLDSMGWKLTSKNR